MTFQTEYILVITAILLVVGVLASVASSRLGVPALVLFLVIGLLAGSDGPGGIYFDDPWLAQFLGVIALAFILFDGGLSTRWSDIRPVLWKGVSLSTLGVVLTTLLVGWFTHWILDIPVLYGMLLGAIVSSTDAAAVFAVLRSKKSALKGELQPLLELESGSNDPMAVFLTVALISLIQSPDKSLWSLLLMFVQQMAVGGVLGLLFGKVMIETINKTRLDYEGLYPVFTMALMLLVFGVTALLGGSGFLAVYIAGIILGNAEFIHKKSLIRFHDGLAWLMQIVMFLTLGLLAFPSQLPPVVDEGLLIAGFLMLVARPVGVFISLLKTTYSPKEKLMISWVGLRGAVPIILATFPLLAGLHQADLFFHIVFFIVLTSVLLQGTTLAPLARWLKVDDPLVTKPQYPLELISAGVSKNDLVDVPISDGSPVVGKRIVDLGLPRDVLIVLISRADDFIVPRGGTVIEPGDALLVLAEKKSLAELRALISG